MAKSKDTKKEKRKQSAQKEKGLFSRLLSKLDKKMKEKADKQCCCCCGKK